jgi:hypothetical protein
VKRDGGGGEKFKERRLVAASVVSPRMSDVYSNVKNYGSIEFGSGTGKKTMKCMNFLKHQLASFHNINRWITTFIISTVM